jgi:maleylpyruvate isomerase
MTRQDTPLPFDPDVIRSDLAIVETRLTEAVGAMTDVEFTDRSNLPGWDRARVVAHLTTLANEFARRAEHAGRGETAGDGGGRAQRAAAVIAAAALSADAQRSALAEALVRLNASWPQSSSPAAVATDAGWVAQVTLGGDTVYDVLLNWWREVRIHTVDLSLGDGFAGWPAALYAHLWDALAVRLPKGPAYEYESTDSALHHSVKGDATTIVHISGTDAEITCWIAGRDQLPLPRAFVDGSRVALPDLGPYPSHTQSVRG